MESLLERVGLGGVVEEVYGSLRSRVLGPPPPPPAPPARRLTEAVGSCPFHEAEPVRPEPPAPAASLSPEPPPPVPAQAPRVEESLHEAAPARPPKASRVRNASPPKKKKAAAVHKAAAPRGKKVLAPPAAETAPAPASESSDAVSALVDALRAHPRHQELLVAGRLKDQLLRSLIPFYLARSLSVEVTSGTTSRFWGELGVTYAAPNAAKALRLNTGFTRDTKKGKALTSKGVKYVEAALTQLRSATDDSL
ncbi:hypothetical protein [Archangium violaceum]|uniref:Uncharacterized protein n=1 Tax=Archangium violaceum Cb vi76 TaxID=1406225 RepID=A0A084ST87_9BACT|nr:hypothetical protein [Archangium violaceum]KFA91672.1 hypothetical protein Q664_20465 [Archangium violaceum Cb vi76]